MERTYRINRIFQNTVALVTGGASGLGRGTVQRFVRNGAKVVIADLPNSKGQQLADQLDNNAAFVPTDVRLQQVDLAFIKALFNYSIYMI